MRAAKGKTQVTLTLKVEAHDRLLELANAEERTLAGYIRWVLNEYLRSLDAEKAEEEHAAGRLRSGVPSRRMVIKAVSSSRRPWCR